MLPFFSAQFPRAVLVLEDGSRFDGYAIGVSEKGSHVVAEIVFNTSMTGYQEILTDPSYTGQMVTLTYPHIGNVGINIEDFESDKIYADGLIIKDLSSVVSNFRSEQSLSEFLIKHQKIGIAGVDTRALTRILQQKGAMGACIYVDDVEVAAENAKQKLQHYQGMSGQDLASQVTCAQSSIWREMEFVLEQGYPQLAEAQYKVVAYDFGVKRNILRMLAQRGCEVHVVPAHTSAADVLAMSPDGVFLSNGPGDPQACVAAIASTQELLKSKLPMFGICLGHQILALAEGAQTHKMKFGHHGANHPVQDLITKRVYITSQNHGFAVDEKTLPSHIQMTHVSLFDGTLQGMEWTNGPVLSFQGHPEASPGPMDVAYLFDRFIDHMAANKANVTG